MTHIPEAVLCCSAAAQCHNQSNRVFIASTFKVRSLEVFDCEFAVHKGVVDNEVLTVSDIRDRRAISSATKLDRMAVCSCRECL